jgi:hypothetical protein
MALVQNELVQLRAAGMKPSAGDIRCIVYGHLTRMAIWRLRAEWDSHLPTSRRLDHVHTAIRELGDAQAVIGELIQPVKSGALYAPRISAVPAVSP